MSYTRNQKPTNEQRKLQLIWENIPSGPLQEVLISETVRIERVVSLLEEDTWQDHTLYELLFYQATHTVTLGQ